MSPTAARIEVFRPGTFTPMNGAPVTFSAADLAAIAAAYDPEAAPAPIVVGHPSTDAPAYGWAKDIEFDQAIGKLFATVGDVEPAFADAVRARRYAKVSMTFFRPDAPNNPKPGTWYPKHIGFLGGRAPAVTGLKPVFFAGDADEALTFEAAFAGPEADPAPPARLEWLTPAAPADPALSDPARRPDVTRPDPDPAFAEREATVAAREERLAERERQLRHDDNVAFAESLVAEGQLIPKIRDKVAALLDALPEDATVSFAGEAEQPLGEALRAILKAQPKVVSFGAYEVGDDPEDGDGTASFAADGKQVDQERLRIHTRALAYQKAHPGADYMTAVAAVS